MLWKAGPPGSASQRILNVMGEMVSAEVLAALDQGTLILTPNERAARIVQDAWDQAQCDRQRARWEPARVLSWHSWMQLLWRRLLLDGKVSALLLTPLQEQWIWRSVISASEISSSVRTVDSLIDLAATAWRRACAYSAQVRLRRSTQYLQGDALQFALWVRVFEDTCRKDSLLSESLLEEELIRHLDLRDVQQSGHGALLLGFDRLTPAQDDFTKFLRSLGMPVAQVEQAPVRECVLVEAKDETQELRGCVRWIRATLDQSPNARIALIINDLEAERERIDSVLRELLSPELENIAADTELAPYEFSLGRPMSHESMIHAALDLLHWAVGPLSLDQVSRLLLSPYFAAAGQEAAARAAFDALGLRHQLRLRPKVTIKALLHELRRNSAAHASLPLLRRALEGMEQAQAQANLHARGFADWAEWVRAWLARSQWGPTSVTLSSREFQLRERWEGALDKLATLDCLGGMIDLREFLEPLGRLTKQLIFAPEGKNASVQILGPLEAAGQHFDAIWVLRTGEMHWPHGKAALPLLPWALQRELGMPGTDPERERVSAQQLTRRLAGSAPKVVFSYAESTSTQGRQRAAACIRDLHLPGMDLIDLVGPEQSAIPIPLESVADDSRIVPLLDQVHRGGVRLLEMQAACGFRAFAELRLGSSELRDRELGLNAIERGSVVHDALEEFWKSVGSQRELHVMGPSEREEMVQRAVTKGLSRAHRGQADRWDKAYLEAQQIRLSRLLRDWLEVELRRPEFTVVAQEEARKNISLGPLRLSVRVDRIDLVDGQQVILDYKTGETSTTEWLGDRPDKPQVPLYAILASKAAAQSEEGASAPLAAVGFGQVRAGKDMRLRGFEAVPGILNVAASGAPARMDACSFQEQVERWHEVLERLAIEFAAGDIRVRPKQYPSTCEHCGQRMLCRLDASSLTDEVDAEDEDHRHG